MDALELYISNVMYNPLYKKDKPFLMYMWNHFKAFYTKDPDPPVWSSLGSNDPDESVY